MAYVLKTTPSQETDRISVTEPFYYGGNNITAGDEIFVWYSETEGGQGLTWHGVVEDVKVSQVTVRLETRVQTGGFGKSCFDRDHQSTADAALAELGRKLYNHSHHKIAAITDEAAALLRSHFVGRLSVEEGARSEVARLKRLGEIASRPGQQEFSRAVRDMYDHKCAITGCCTPEALDAAHIRTASGVDNNNLSNGILLRADIHALFDRGLFTLSADGSRLELSQILTDGSYEFLQTVAVFRPRSNAPSPENIRRHRQQFGYERE